MSKYTASTEEFMIYGSHHNSGGTECVGIGRIVNYQQMGVGGSKRAAIAGFMMITMTNKVDL